MEAISLNNANGSIEKSNRILKQDVDILLTAINKIVFTEVLEKELSNSLPIMDDLSDSNKIYHGKVSMLFVDMRESTKLPDKFSIDQLVKIYRSYIRTIVQAVRYSGGVVRDFMGDGVLAAFIDDEEDTSENKAVYAARYIVTSIDKLLNPVLDQAIGHIISCGVGIHTGEVSLSKVGMRGKEQVKDAEDEFGIAWIGNSINLACKYSGAVDNGTIFISSSTYSALSDLVGKQQWREIEISKGRNILKGFTLKILVRVPLGGFGMMRAGCSHHAKTFNRDKIFKIVCNLGYGTNWISIHTQKVEEKMKREFALGCFGTAF